MGTYVELFGIIFKIVLYIMKAIIGYNADEYKLFQERISTVAELLKKAVTNQMDSLDEKSYLSNKEWEVAKRYEEYKKAIFALLSQGLGIIELSKVEIMGMGLRVEERKQSVIPVLSQPGTVIEKSMMIAKILSDPDWKKV